MFICLFLIKYHGITHHDDDFIMGAMAAQVTSLMSIFSAVYSMHRSKKTPELRVTGLCAGNSPMTCELPTQGDSNAENISFWWCHHASEQQQNPRHSISYKLRGNNIISRFCIFISSPHYMVGLAQDCGISYANTQEILQSCAKPSISSPPMRSLCCPIPVYQRVKSFLPAPVISPERQTCVDGDKLSEKMACSSWWNLGKIQHSKANIGNTS